MMRLFLAWVVVVLAGCGSNGPAVVAQTRPTADAARRAAGTDYVRRAEEAIAQAPDNYLRDMAIDKLIEAKARLGDVAGAKKLADGVIPENRASRLIDIGREQGLNGDLAGARGSFAVARGLIHDSNWDTAALARTQAEVGDLAAARKTFAGLESWKAELLLVVAEREREGGAIDSAKVDLTAVRKMQRDNPDGMWQLAIGWYRVGDLPTAEACIGEMKERLDQAEAWAQLAGLECEAGDTASGLTSANRAKTALASDATTSFKAFRVSLWVAEALAECGDRAGANALLSSVKKEVPQQFTDERGNPHRVIAYGRIATSQARCGDAAGNAETIQMALAQIPELPEDSSRVLALWSLADGQAVSGKMDQAVALIARAGQYSIPDTSQTDFYMNLAMCIQEAAQAAAGDGTPDLSWIEQLPAAGEKANAYAAAAYAFGIAAKPAVASSTSKP